MNEIEALTPDANQKLILAENRLSSLFAFIKSISTNDFKGANNHVDKQFNNDERELLNNFMDAVLTNQLFPKINQDRSLLLIKIVIDNLPFPVFIKDENKKYLIINHLEASLFQMEENEILGKEDADFVKEKEELSIIQSSDDIALSGEAVELPKQSFTLCNGNTYLFKTHKVPFLNPVTGRMNILGFSVDVTDTESLNKIKKIQILYSNPVF